MAESLAQARHATKQLIDFLSEITESAVRNPELDILDTDGAWNIQWIGSIPDNAGRVDLSSENVLFSMRPPDRQPTPNPSEALKSWLKRGHDWTDPAHEPDLRQAGTAIVEYFETSRDLLPEEEAEPPQSVVREFGHWLGLWRAWAQEQRRTEALLEIYDFLEKAAKEIEQRDDQFELVLAYGLVTWTSPSGSILRRHLLTEQVQPELHHGTAEVGIRRISSSLRFEDSQVFDEEDDYQRNRAEDIRDAIVEAFEKRAFDDQFLELLVQWTSRCADTGVQPIPEPGHQREPGPRMEVSMSPAFILRPRNKAMLAEAYKRIARELEEEPDPELPVALAQLVCNTEPDQRQEWIKRQNGLSGDLLGADPRFPLPANPEQEHVMELLRTESGVVVQGPPGTGKTHTIANLVCALLARGQRVLVTSQKDQALRVLREKIPQEMRSLCVLLAGGSKDASEELRKGIESLSDTVARSDGAQLLREAEEYREERSKLRCEASRLNDEIGELRETENKHHDSAVPWDGTATYSGVLSDIVRRVKQRESAYAWLPMPESVSFAVPPPLAEDELRQLRKLLTDDRAARRARVDQWIPELEQVPPAGRFSQLVYNEQAAGTNAKDLETPASRLLAPLPEQRLAQLDELRKLALGRLLDLGFTQAGERLSAPEWTERALSDIFAGQKRMLWAAPLRAISEVTRTESELHAYGFGPVVEVATPVPRMLGAARGALRAGEELESYLRRGGKMKTRFRLSKEQRNADRFLSLVQVDGQPPSDLPTVQAAITHLKAEISAAQLIKLWADCDVPIPVNLPLTATLSQLAEHGQKLEAIGQLAGIRDRVQTICGTLGPTAPIRSLTSMLTVLNSVQAARARATHLRAQDELTRIKDLVCTMAERHDACPELSGLLTAVQDQDPEAYRQATEALVSAREEQQEAILLNKLSGRLGDVHPQLLALLAETAADPSWESRLAHLPEAWAWCQAVRFVESHRSTGHERELSIRYRQLEDEIARVTSRLAAAEAKFTCLDGMTDEHARDLRTYREYMDKIGAGTGKRVREYRRAARAAMRKAKEAVPAWVVPLPNLLDNLPPERNSFDVVIVDEASQVGMEQLFLLWLAPRVIVVGDDKQCTPGENRLGGTITRVFEELDRYLGDVSPDIRTLFTPKTNLYGLLSARSGKDAVVRLREHFRCVPEIIRWPSDQFYKTDGGSGLVPLRERQRSGLPPLVTRYVENAEVEGRDDGRRNKAEATAIVDQLALCLRDPRYDGKTFGVVVLQSQGQIKLLDHEISNRVSPEDREKRKIRVGRAPDFQGDERDVIFLSMMVAGRPRAQTAPYAQQAYNVAVSRAKDQLWLFSSVTLADLKAHDLRASLLGYMQNPPSPFGSSPELSEVSDTERSEPFDSLLEQKVFREIKSHGYHVVPQYEVGHYTLDLVVVDDGARIAVECDGHRFHTSPGQVASDARRDHQLARMGWEVIRVRESEFEFDRNRELKRVWAAIDARGIAPRGAAGQPTEAWTPVALDDSDEADAQPRKEAPNEPGYR